MLSIHFLTSFVSFSQKSAKYSTHPHPILQPRHYHELYPSPKPINGQYYSKDAEVDIIVELCQEEFLPSQSAHKLCWLSPSRDPEFRTGASLFQTELTKLVISHLEFCCVFTSRCNLRVRISCNHFGLALRFGNVIWAAAWCMYIYSEPATQASNFSLDRCEWCLAPERTQSVCLFQGYHICSTSLSGI